MNTMQKKQRATTREDLEQEIAELQKQLISSQKFEALGVLALSIGHEFNNVLQFIWPKLELIVQDLSENPKADLKEVLALIEEASGMIHSMMGFKGADSIKLISFENSVNNLMPLLRLKIKKVNPLIKIKTFFLAIQKIRVNSGAVAQLITNLCYNSIQALQETKVGPQITIITKDVLLRPSNEFQLPSGAYSYLQISDNGCGIDQEFLPSIFDTFATTHQKNGGSGLGLFITKQIIEKNSGSLIINSNKKRTDAIIHIPIT
jgi:signal transduction histidine kinase